MIDTELYLKYIKAAGEAKRWKKRYLECEKYGKKLPGDSEIVQKLTDLSNSISSRQEDTAVLDAAIKKLRSMEWRTGNPDEPGRYLVTIMYPMAVKSSVTLLKWRKMEVYSKGTESESEMCWVEYDQDYGYYRIDGRVIRWMPLPEPCEEGAEE